MYNLNMPIFHQHDDEIPIIKKLFKELLGYTDREIQQFIDNKFACIVVKNLTLEQAKQIADIFVDNDISIYPSTHTSNNILSWTDDLGVWFSHNPPKEHYCDEPLVSREHLVNPYTQKEIERKQNLQQQTKAIDWSNTQKTQNTVICPYCHSANVSRIGLVSRMVSVELWGLASRKIGKQWHCNKCGSDF